MTTGLLGLSWQQLVEQRLADLETSVIFDTDSLTSGGAIILADGNIFVGNVSNLAAAVAMSGDATIANTGALTIAAGAVTPAKMANASAQYKFLVSGATPFAYAESGGGLNITALKTLTVSESLTLTAGAAGQTYTFPAAGGTVALLNAANSFTLINPLTTIAESWIGPSSTTGIYFKGGNVGIGTTSPERKLVVESASDASIGLVYTGAGNGALFNKDSSGNLNIYADEGGTVKDTIFHKWGSTNSEVMRITSAGNVGIGTAGPDARLHALGATSGITAVFDAGATTPGDILQLRNSAETVLTSFGSTGLLKVFAGIADGVNIALQTTTGTKIGTATTQKLSFWNATPIVQPSGATQAALAAYATGAFGLDSDAHMQGLYDLVVAMRTALVDSGIIKGAA